METESLNYNSNVKWSQRIVGLASYLVTKYIFHLMYYVNVLVRHTMKPYKQVNWMAKNLVEYLWDRKDYQLIWKIKESDIIEFSTITDASFSNQEDCKS